jgi:hypothetical protein
VRARLSVATPTTSGATLLARITEAYAFYSGTEARPEPFLEDLIAYQTGGSATTLLAATSVTPSLTFDPLELERGVITVELFAPGAVAPLPLVLPHGGSIDGPAGIRLVAPPGAVPDASAIVLGNLDATDLGTLPAGLTLIQGVQVTMASALARGASLSVPRPDGLASTADVLLVRFQDIQGATRLVLAGVVRFENDRLVADTVVANQQTALSGVTEPGRYAFVRTGTALGFAGGLVKGVNAQLFPGALVTSGGFQIVSLSNATGAYLAASPAGNVLLTATDLLKSDSGNAASFLTEGVLLPVSLQLVAQPPRVIELSPANGATNVPLSGTVTVKFSEAIDPLSVAGANLANVTLADAGGVRVEGGAALSHGNTVLTFRPAAALAPNSQYRIALGTGISDTSGYGLTAEVTASFESLDTNPPPQPAAGQVSAAIPNAQGLATITGTQGTAGPNDRVFVDNVTKGTVAVALVEPNGSFSTVIAAGLNDKLRIRIVDTAGNEMQQELGGFKQTNADGSVSQAISAEGGIVQGPGGVQATIKPGTFPAGAVVTLKDMQAEEFPVQFSPKQSETFTVNGGVSIDFGGATPELYVDVSLPPTGNEQPDDQWLVARLATLNGQQVFDVVDTGKFRNGRITTASPPCPGVTAAGAYGFIKSRQQIGVNYAQAMPNGGEFAAKMFSQIGLFFSQTLIYDTLETMLSAAGGVGQVIADSMLPEVDLPLVNILTDLQQRERQQPCFPVLTGDVTVSPNSARISIAGEELTPSDRQIIVTNVTTNEERQFPRDIPELRFLVPGVPSDNFRVTIAGFPPSGGGEAPTRSIQRFDAAASDPATVAVRLNPDDLDTPVKTIIVRNLRREVDHVFALTQVPFEGGVAGSSADLYQVTVVNAKGQGRVVMPLVSPPPFGAGNMLARARLGTIDPTRAEMDALNLQGPARTKVHIINDKGLTLEIPPASIVTGGFAHAFDGDPAAKYSIVVFYDTRPPYSIGIPNFRIEVTSTRTGKVLKTMKAHAPPRDEPLQLEPIANDETHPVITSGPTQPTSFDPSGLLTFTFSEAMEAGSVRGNVTVLDAKGATVDGEVRISGGNRVATFVPTFALKAGETYTIVLKGAESENGQKPTGGMRDLGNNSIATMRMEIRTFIPTRVGRFENGSPIKDVAMVRRQVPQDNGPPLTRTTLFVTTGAQSQNLISVDATDATQPLFLGSHAGQASRQKVTVLPEIAFLGRDGNPYSGDLAITTTFNVNSSSLQFVDVRNPLVPATIGGKVLTINPDLALPGYERHETMFATGFAKGVAALKVAGGGVAYAAVERVGLMAVDIPNNTPLRPQGQRVLEGVYACDAMDIAAWKSSVAGLCRDDRRLVILDPSLGVLSEVGLPYVPRRLRVVENLPYDVNGDAVITGNEIFDLAVIGGDNGLSVVNVSNPIAPVVINALTFSGVIRDLDVDSERRRVFAGGELAGSGPSLMMLDLSNPFFFGEDDSFDKRLLWKQSYPSGLNGLRLDRQRGLAYIANPSGLDIYAMYDTCCDVRIDLTAEPELEMDQGARDELLRAEQKALQQGIAAGLAKAQAVCGLNPDWIRIFESGSSACIWDPDPAKTCTKNYQPGVSDHDLSAFFTQAAYSNKMKMADEYLPDEPPVTDTTGLSKACTPTMKFDVDEWSMANCTIRMLTDQFVDKDKQPIKFDINGVEVRFEDISFIPNSLEKNGEAKYDLCPTDPNVPGDAVNDMALGRQLLVMKHVTEARWINVPGWDGSVKDSQGRLQQLAGQPIEETFVKLRENGIPLAEGYEWANLMEWNFVKSGSLIRIPGAADETSVFHHKYIKQLHTGGKAGIRAAAARMVADPLANRRFLMLTRAQVEAGTTQLAMDVNACLFAMPSVDSRNWPSKPCDSLEEYIASAAARTLRPWDGQPPLNLFSEADVQMIHRFYRVKSDQEIITDDQDANELAADIIRFVMRVQQETKPAYDAYMASPDVSEDEKTQRIYNMNLKARELDKALKKAEIHVIPRISNLAFKDANGVLVKMFTDGAAATYKAKDATKVLEMRVDLGGGDRHYLEWERDANGFEIRNAKGKRTPFFLLGPLDQTKDLGVAKAISFTIDLPARTVREADRRDNVGGFFYWLMDKDNPSPIPPQMNPEGLIPPPVEALLGGDPACTAQPELRVTQAMTVDKQTFEGPPAVLGIGQSAMLHIRVTNDAGEPADEARACSNVTNTCYSLGSMAAGATKTIDVPFVRNEQAIVDAVPTAYAVNRAIITGEPFRIVVACERYAIVPFFPDPNPTADRSTIMTGGTALRHYQVIDRSTGKPLTGVTVRAQIAYAGGNSVTSTFTTDEEGTIGTGGPGAFVAGVAVPSNDSSGRIEVAIDAVDGVPVACNAAPKRFTVDVKPITFTEAVKAGASISGEFSVVGGTGKLGAGAGFSVALSGERVPGGTPSYSKLTLGRTANITRGIKYKKSLFDVGLRVGARFELQGPGGEYGYELGTNSGEKYTFPSAELQGSDERGAGGLILGGLLDNDVFGDASFYKDAIGYLTGSSEIDVPTLEDFKTSESIGFSVIGSASLNGLRASARLGSGEEQYVGEPVFAFDAGLNAKAGVSLNFETLLKEQKLKADLGLNGEFSIGAGLNLGFIEQSAKIDADEPSTYVRKVKKDTLRKETDRLRIGGDIAAGVKFTATLDSSKNFKPEKIDITFTGRKNFGLKVNFEDPKKGSVNLNDGSQHSITYSTTIDELMTKSLQHLDVLNVLMATDQRQGTLPDGGVLLRAAATAGGPTSVWQSVMAFLNDVLDAGTYTRNDERGVSIPLTFGFKAAILGTGGDLEAKLNFDQSVSWPGQRGLMIGSRLFVLEDYTGVDLPLSSASELVGEITEIIGGTGGMLSPFFKTKKDKTPGPGNTTEVVNDNAAVQVDQTDGAALAGMISYAFKPQVGPVAPAPYESSDTTGRADRPHYGIGGFHAMEPGGLTLQVPGSIRIGYSAAEVQGIDVSTLQAYRWDAERNDWTPIGGQVDPVNRVVTATITRLGTYTLGPRMPAGRITWTITNVAAAGGNTRVTLQSSVITNNDGTAVAPGGLVHVSVTPEGSPTSLGSVLTPDVDGALEGHQVAIGADGRIQLQVEMFGPPSVINLLAFTDIGTAMTAEVIEVHQP